MAEETVVAPQTQEPVNTPVPVENSEDIKAFKELVSTIKASRTGKIRPAAGAAENKKRMPWDQPSPAPEQKQDTATPAPTDAQTPAPAAVPVAGATPVVATSPTQTPGQVPEPDWIKKIEPTGFKTIDELIADYNTQKQKAAKPAPELKDDFIKKAVDYYNANGTLTPYLSEASTDYDKMGEDELIRRELREKHPEYSEKAFNRLLEKEMAKYEPDEDADEDDIEIAKEEKKIQAERTRKKFKDRQQEFLDTVNKPDAKAEEIKAAVEAQRKQFVDTITQAEPVKNLFGSKKITYKFKNHTRELDVEHPEEIFGAMVDEAKLFQNFVSKEGVLDYDRVIRVYDHARKGEKYDEALIQMGMDMKEAELKNFKMPNQQQSVTAEFGQDPEKAQLKKLMDGLRAYYGKR